MAFSLCAAGSLHQQAYDEHSRATMQPCLEKSMQGGVELQWADYCMLTAAALYNCYDRRACTAGSQVDFVLTALDSADRT